MNRLKSDKGLFIIIGSLVVLCLICIGVGSLSSGRPTPTPGGLAQATPTVLAPTATPVSTSASMGMQIAANTKLTATAHKTAKPRPPTREEIERIKAGLVPTPRPTPQPTVTPQPTPMPDLRVAAQVVEVVDGDTIKVSFGGQTYTVRYIGVDTPETVHPSEPVQWMGPEASAANAQLVAGQTVLLEKDVSETDKYGRLLRYVWAGELMVNAELVRLGYAQVSTYPPDVRYQDLFLRLQAEARDAERGLWGTPPAATPVPVVQPTAAPREGCDPAYPDVCIPPPPPDLDCGDIPYRRFRVLPPDPHRFDGDKDGIGCES